MDIYHFTKAAPETVAGFENTGAGTTIGMEPEQAAEGLAAGHLIPYGEWRPQPDDLPETVDDDEAAAHAAAEAAAAQEAAEAAAAVAAEQEAKKAKAAEKAAAKAKAAADA